MTSKDYYAVLEVKPDADITEIEKAYRELVDIYSHNSTGTYSLYEDEQRDRLLLEIEEAYKVLSNDAKRKQYDNVYLISDYKDAKSEGKEIKKDASKGKHAVQAMKQSPATDKAAEILKDFSPEKADGKLLKDLRAAASMSLKDVSEQTRISARHISLIEENVYSEMPGRTYVLGFVKLYFKIFTEDCDRFALGYIRKFDEFTARKAGSKQE